MLPSASAAAEEQSTTTSLGLRITREANDRDLLVVRGSRQGAGITGQYSITADFQRLPCPGHYRFLAEQEDQLRGVSSTYRARMVLFSLTPYPEGIPCGAPVPARPGRGKVKLIGESEPLSLFSLDVGRAGIGSFVGDLTLRSLPECNERYTLETNLDLRRWHRTYRFQLRVLARAVTSDGIPYPSLGC